MAMGAAAGGEGCGLNEQTSTPVRVAVLLYIAVLWMAVGVSVRPSVVEAPVVGPALGAAAKALASMTLVPGIPVFTAPGREWSDWITTSICMSFTGHRDGREPLTLYAPQCPPVGFRWRHDAFDELMQYTTRHIRLSPLLDPPKIQDPSELSEPGRRFAMLGDFFCHSPLVAPPDLEALTLRWTMHVRHYETAETARQTLVCNWLCNTPGSYAPNCKRGPMSRPQSSGEAL
jgi:hypothetical protein